MKHLALLSTALFALAAPAGATESPPKPSFTPIQLTVWTDLQLFSEKRDVLGLRLNLGQGVNEGVYGLDFGIANLSNDAGGIEVGFYNSTKNGFVGIQVATLANRAGPVGAVSYGLAVAPFNGACHSRGITIGIVNLTSEVFAKGDTLGIEVGAFNYATMVGGAQLGPFNIADELMGVQAGLFNGAGDWFGLQVGLVNWSGVRAQGLQVGVLNYARSMRGVQLGLVNVIGDGALLFLPVVNAHF